MFAKYGGRRWRKEAREPSAEIYGRVFRSWFDGQRVADLLAEFRRRCPEIVLDVSFEDRLVDLVEVGCDVAMRVTARPDSLPAGLIARPVRSVQFYVGGSREYLKRKGTPKVPGDLAQHDCVAVGSAA